MKQEFPIEDQWLPYEIHPDTPAEGVLLADYFPGMDPAQFFRQLDARGQSMGVRFGPQTRMSNSRTAMEAGEFAKEHGKHHEFHEAVFKAFFTDCKDIGDLSLILELAANAGLDRDALQQALDKHTYLPVLNQTTRQAQLLGVKAAPTFIVDGYPRITGAQPTEQFRQLLSTIMQDRIA